MAGGTLVTVCYSKAGALSMALLVIKGSTGINIHMRASGTDDTIKEMENTLALEALGKL